MAFLGGWKYKLSKQRIKSNTHAEGIFYFIFQKEAIFAGADTLSRLTVNTRKLPGETFVREQNEQKVASNRLASSQKAKKYEIPNLEQGEVVRNGSKVVRCAKYTKVLLYM